MSAEYVNITLFNPNNSELNGVPIHNLPEIKRYEGRFQLKDYILQPIIGETKVRFSNILLDCSIDTGLFAALEGNRPFHLHERETGRQIVVLKILEEPTKVSRLDELMEAKPVIAMHALANRMGKIAHYFFK